MVKHTLQILRCEHVWPFFNIMHESINYFENGGEPENRYLSVFFNVASPIVSVSFPKF